MTRVMSLLCLHISQHWY